MKATSLLVLSLALTVLLLGGCGPTVDMTKTGKGFFAPTDADHVEVLATLPKKNFVELATFSTSGWSTSQTAKMHNGIRQKAAGIGANAVVIQNSGINRVRSGFGTTGYLWSTGVALHYKE